MGIFTKRKNETIGTVTIKRGAEVIEALHDERDVHVRNMKRIDGELTRVNNQIDTFSSEAYRRVQKEILEPELRRLEEVIADACDRNVESEVLHRITGQRNEVKYLLDRPVKLEADLAALDIEKNLTSRALEEKDAEINEAKEGS